MLTEVATSPATPAPGGPVIRCPGCGQRIRWRGTVSGRAACPTCHIRFVVRLSYKDQLEVLAESEESVAGMICDWLKPDYADEED